MLLMHKAMSRLALLGLAALLFIAGCVNEPIATAPSNNADIRVDELFTHDGCTVFRFKDGPYHYYVRCTHQPAATATVSCIGKNCQDDDTIQTVSQATR